MEDEQSWVPDSPYVDAGRWSIKAFISFYKTTIHIFRRQRWHQRSSAGRYEQTHSIPAREMELRDELLFVFLISLLGYLAPSLLAPFCSRSCWISQPRLGVLRTSCPEFNPKPRGIGDYVTRRSFEEQLPNSWTLWLSYKRRTYH